LSRLNTIGAAEAAKRLNAGTISSEALVRDCLERIEAREGQVKAWEYIDPDYAIAQAKALDAMPRRSVLHGVPVGVKDIFDTLDMPTAHGFPPFFGQRGGVDSACVAVMRAAGMVIMGKTVTTEFACPVPRMTTCNPHDLSRTPGVSSSGSAAAVADCMIPLAIGSQTGGSIILPAAFCGVYGYKSSPTALDRTGYRHGKPSLDSIGLFGRSMDDLLLLRSVQISAAAPQDGARQSPPRIGLPRSRIWETLDPATRSAMENTVRILQRAGAGIGYVDLPETIVPSDDFFAVVTAWETADVMAEEIRNHGPAFNAFNRRKIDVSKSVTQDQYQDTLQKIAAIQSDVNDMTRDYDVLLLPSAPGEAPLATPDPIPDDFAKFWSLLRTPAANLPLYKGAHGLPLGIQVIGKPDKDADMLGAAAWIDRKVRDASA